MRKLTEQELDQIKRAIAAKELTSAEILLEIYDHYISHLESFEESEFDPQLAELEGQWTSAHCKKLQYDLEKSISSSLRSTQWQVVKTYFTWPRFIFTITMVAFLSLLVNLLAFKTQIVLLFGLPLAYLAGFALLVNLQNRERMGPIKNILGKHVKKITSIFNAKLTLSIVFPLHFYNLFLNLPRLFGWTDMIPESTLNLLSVGFCFLMVLHSLSIYEAWKIKSKTALV
ncbi:hypothetical protein PBT90_03430 [Algoriphagus halophytocola]|uniref:DUF1700 domain-containing protein n=1 Tax=Algoriphagus halophytocola TaxID=2991499 RepID=A0ABY6MJW3_9BACT|nr:MULTISPECIES: hypothetical protein [unclassified Algoriphagus]UZD22479.1 hypothetical protein OM944_17710 [Algoriphagus sp. TR-M5]WBL43739.1 hypothetical protein PBT90_03430 [Algoriphagus sp. TR-M9]